MILVDVNLLVYAAIARSPEHNAAKAWLDQQLSGAARVGLPWATILGFLRVVTHPRLFTPQVSSIVAWGSISAWLGAEAAWIPQPTEHHAEILARLLALPGIHGNLVPDAHLAALAIEHGLTLYSSDGDFARFPGLNWVNPLAA